VTGVSTGTAIISATSEGKVGTATVTIQPGVPSVTVSPNSATLDFLGRVKLSAVVRDPSGAIINPSVSWSSSNPLVALVASDGTVTAQFTQGTAIISATYSTATGTATITVKFGG
jgi:lactocepin